MLNMTFFYYYALQKLSPWQSSSHIVKPSLQMICIFVTCQSCLACPFTFNFGDLLCFISWIKKDLCRTCPLDLCSYSSWWQSYIIPQLFVCRYSGKDEGLPTCWFKLAYTFIREWYKWNSCR